MPHCHTGASTSLGRVGLQLRAHWLLQLRRRVLGANWNCVGWETGKASPHPLTPRWPKVAQDFISKGNVTSSTSKNGVPVQREDPRAIWSIQYNKLGLSGFEFSLHLDSQPGFAFCQLFDLGQVCNHWMPQCPPFNTISNICLELEPYVRSMCKT